MQSKPDYPQQVYDRIIAYRDRFEADLTASELSTLTAIAKKLEEKRIEIAVFGMVSRGKSSLINSLLGSIQTQTGAIHGVTKEVAVYEWEVAAKTKLRLIDTQGIDEVGGELRAEQAQAAAKDADFILFVTEGDLNRIELEAIAELQSFYKPILLIFNKTDLYEVGDRHAIYQSLQKQELLQQYLSPQEIVLTAAAPKPIKVRLQYSDGRLSQEMWEQPQPDVQALKERIVTLLNQEGKELLALNGLRSLLDVQNAVTQRHIHKSQSATAIIALLFVVEAIGILLSPFSWLDALISGIEQTSLMLWLVGKYPIQGQYLWVLLIVAIAGGLGLLNDYGIAYGQMARYVQILLTGLGIVGITRNIVSDLEQTQGMGNLGAKPLIAEVISRAPSNSIIKRFQHQHQHIGLASNNS